MFTVALRVQTVQPQLAVFTEFREFKQWLPRLRP
jgi:hypothetical protein